MADLPDILPIKPFTAPLSANRPADNPQRVALPGSKSITNRALILAALSDGPVTLRGALFSRDTRIMGEALTALGFSVETGESAKTIRIEGRGGDIPVAEADIHVGNAGTAARFLTALLALKKGGRYRLDGDAAMRRRPMQGLTGALAEQGARFTFHEKPGHFPFTMETHGLRGGTLEVDAAASSQILSALMMAAPLARAPVSLKLKGGTVSEPFVAMTVAKMHDFSSDGAIVEEHPSCWRFKQIKSYSSHNPKVSWIEPDATAASYFAALALAAQGRIGFTGSFGFGGSIQGDAEFFSLLHGKDLTTVNTERPLVAPGSSRAGIIADFNAFSDTFLTLAAVAPLLEGPTVITGIGHTRHQETDRIHAMDTELRRLGQKTETTRDSLTIHPDREAMRAASADKPVAIETYEDHRVAMSFAILGCHDLHGDGRPWLAIKDPACCAKTFPDFFDKLEQLRRGNDAV